MIINGSKINGRLIFIGDVHGCYNELILLLKKIQPSRNDIVISLGDFLDRGPEPEKCLDLWIKSNYLFIVGNHDLRIINWAKGISVPEGEDLNRSIKLVGNNKFFIKYLSNQPEFIFFKKLKIFAVHAAVDVNKDIAIQINDSSTSDIFMRGRHVRFIDKYIYIDTGKELVTDYFWWDKWKGCETIVFGHTPQLNGMPLLKDNIIGIDTGCVYGGNLTAAIFNLNSKWSFISVPAKKKYWNLAKKDEIVLI